MSGARDKRDCEWPTVHRGSTKYTGFVYDRSRLLGAYRFEDRRVESSLLVCIIAGNKPSLWPIVLPYIEEAAAGNYVCIVSPGVYDNGLSLLCKEWGWSYLSTSTSDPGRAQDICYELHEDAKYIVKVDEDMFLLPNSISALVERHRNIRAEGIISPGFIAPFVPIDLLSYRYLLEDLDLLELFEARFGNVRRDESNAVLLDNPEAALWIWEHTAPLSKTAKRLAAKPERLVCAPGLSGLGMVAFERSFWEAMGSCFPSSNQHSAIGSEYVCKDRGFACSFESEKSHPFVVTSHVLAGRFSFDSQFDNMRVAFEEQPKLFRV